MTANELIDLLVEERGFPPSFPPSLLEEAKTAAATPDVGERVDLRDRALVTIDDDTAHDFDDAVGCEKQSDGSLLLTVAIADVAAYVKAGSPLDQEAAKRGNSVYLPDRVLPMLPPTLSNDICSLKPRQDRLCVVCEMRVKDGLILGYRLYRGIMKSADRLNYESAAAAMEAQSSPSLSALAQVAKKFRQRRADDGGMLLEKPEKYCRVDDQGKIKAGEKNRNIAHFAIEEAMIAANRCVADHLIEKGILALHRIHTKPVAEKLEPLMQALSSLGLSLPKNPRAADFGEVLMTAQARNPILSDALIPVVLGALSRAEYRPDEKTGHFGLGYQRYLHFTSPIRRYPDLINHRLLIAALEKSPPTYSRDELTGIGNHCSECEIRADKAGWECRQRLLCETARAMVGCTFSGMVSGFSQNALFVLIPELSTDGMMRLSELPGYWKREGEAQRLKRTRDGKIISLGDEMEVRLQSVTPEAGRMELVPA